MEDEAAADYGLETRGTKREPPCAQCRQRKIKCDKRRPCDNCTRSGLTCLYRGAQLSPGGRETYGELQNRVAQLEDQLRALTSRLLLPAAGHDPAQSSTETDSGGSETPSPLECRCGRQISGTNFSLHYDSDLYWVDLFPRLRDKYFHISANATNNASLKDGMPLLASSGGLDHSVLDQYHLSLMQTDQMIAVYLENVNPFIRTFNRHSFFTDLDQFRLGRLPQPGIFSGLLFSIYGLATISLPSSTVKEMFGVERQWLSQNFQEAQELALQQVDFVNSNDIAVFQNFILYLVFLFERRSYQTASALIGLAARNAQRLGLHKDPSWFNYTQWVSEWRRRLWNQLILLDQKAIVLQGAESILTFPWDTKLPANLGDDVWDTSPSSKPSDTPRPSRAFSEMTSTLVKRRVLATLCPLRQNLRTRKYSDQISHIENGLASAQGLFQLVEDDKRHLANFVHGAMEIDFCTQTLMAGQARLRFGGADQAFELQHFLDAIDLLDKIVALELQTLNTNWLWIFRGETCLVAIATVLSYLWSNPDNQDAARAWTMVDHVMEHYLNCDESHRPAVLLSIQDLRDQTQLARLRVSPVNISLIAPLDYSVSQEQPEPAGWI